MQGMVMTIFKFQLEIQRKSSMILDLNLIRAVIDMRMKEGKELLMPLFLLSDLPRQLIETSTDMKDNQKDNKKDHPSEPSSALQP